MTLRIATNTDAELDAIALAEAESVLVPLGVKLRSTSGAGISAFGPSHNALVLGSIEAGEAGISFIGGTAARIHIGVGATIDAGADGLAIDSDGMVILNRGSITSVAGNGLTLTGRSGAIVGTGATPPAITFSVRNTGTIIGEKAISSIGANLVLVNEGVLTGLGGTAIDAAALAGVDPGSGSSFRNTGTVYGDVFLPSYVRLNNKGTIDGDLTFQGYLLKGVNSGLITGDVTLDKFGGKFVNTGIIEGDFSANASKYASGLILDNSKGQILGLVKLSGGSDKYIAGSGDEQVSGGLGEDTLSFARFTAGIVVDLFGGSVIEGPGLGMSFNGFEKIFGTGYNDTFIGDLATSALYIVAGNGSDTVSGGSGADYFIGGRGADTLSGGAGNDSLLGADDNDILVGGAGGDGLYGGDGNDQLDGGADADGSSGGLGKDTFIFDKSVIGQADPDSISDFSGLGGDGDRIDLSRIDAIGATAKDDPFAFIGTAAFGKIAGQLRFEVSGSKVNLSGDTNGDGVADFTIVLSNMTKALVAADLIL